MKPQIKILPYEAALWHGKKTMWLILKNDF